MTKRNKWAIALMIGGVLLVILAIFGVPDIGKGGSPTAATDSSRKYAASYDFSKVSGKADSQTFSVPSGNGWVLVSLPADYRATFSSATANTGELDKLDGSKPLKFEEKTEFGKLPMAVAIRVPEGCEMTVSFVQHQQTKLVKQKKGGKNFVKMHATRERTSNDTDRPSTAQMM